MAGPRFAFPALRHARDADRGGKPSRINILRRRNPQEVAAVLTQQPAVLFLLSRIAAEVLIGAELHRVDEDGRCDCVRARLSFARSARCDRRAARPSSAPAPAFRRPDRNGRVPILHWNEPFAPESRAQLISAWGALFERCGKRSSHEHSRISSSSPTKRAGPASRRPPCTRRLRSPHPATASERSTSTAVSGR